MRPYLILGGCVATLLIAVGLICLNSKPLTLSPISSEAPQSARQEISAPNAIRDIVKPPIHKFKSHYPLTPEEAAMMKWRAETIAKDPASDWKTAINFYGLVIDESNQPLPGAKVEWITTNITGNGHGSTTSGYDGRFFIGTNGKDMNVMVQKDGYRTVERTADFEFAAFFQDNYYDHDKDNPVIFHLRKISAFEPIYIWNGGSRNDLVRDKISINPKTGKMEHGELPEGMWIQFVPGPQDAPGSEQYDIVLGTAAGGGAILVSGDTDENAPESGYQNPLDSQLVIDFQGQRIFKRKVFFKDSEGHYGSFDFDVKLLAHQLDLTYLLKYNPGGGTSLSAPAHSEFQINKTQY